MSEDKVPGTPKWPFGLEVMSEITELEHVNLTLDSFDYPDDLEDLLHKMWKRPEAKHYVHVPTDASFPAALLEAREANIINWETTEYRWFADPRPDPKTGNPIEGHFIHIDMATAKGWWKDVAENTPMFARTRIQLSEMELRRRNFAYLEGNLGMNKKAEVFHLKPSLWGFGIDLKALAKRYAGHKVWKWIMGRFSQ